MAKVLCKEDVDHFNNTRLGCMSGIYHALDYQYWHSNIKKILPHRKQSALVNRIKPKQPPPRPKLQRTYSIHRLENNEWVRPVLFFPENGNSEELSEKELGTPVSSNEPGQDDTRSEIDDFKMNKDLDSSGAAKTKAILIKSGSFPSAYKPSSRNLRPIELKHKVNEFYVFKNTNRLDNLTPKSAFPNEFANKLFDYSGTKEASLYRSRTLKLTNESENFFRRIRSLPHLDDSNQEPHDTRFLRSSSQNERNPVCTGLDSKEGTKCLNGMVYRSDISEDAYMQTVQEGDHQKAHDISTRINPVLVAECCPQEEKTRSEFQISEEEQIKKVIGNRCTQLSNEQYHDDEYFTYTREILELSGFIKNGFRQKWHSSDQPLDPSVFQEMESRYPHDPERFEQELVELSQHLLCFDLVNEALLKIYETSLSYYPTALSRSCHLRPAPTGKLVLEEVWKSLTRLLNLKPDSDQSLDSITSRDLWMNDGWMNLQLDSEHVVLELEDRMFKELLEEVFCS